MLFSGETAVLTGAKCEVAYDSNQYTFTATRDYGTSIAYTSKTTW